MREKAVAVHVNTRNGSFVKGYLSYAACYSAKTYRPVALSRYRALCGAVVKASRKASADDKSAALCNIALNKPVSELIVAEDYDLRLLSYAI